MQRTTKAFITFGRKTLTLFVPRDMGLSFTSPTVTEKLTVADSPSESLTMSGITRIFPSSRSKGRRDRRIPDPLPSSPSEEQNSGFLKGKKKVLGTL